MGKIKIRKPKGFTAAVCSALAATTAVVAPLTAVACANATHAENYSDFGGEYDKEYGIDMATYRALQTAFWSKYKIKYLKDKKETEIQAHKRTLFNVMKQLEMRRENSNLSYTALTNSLIDYASTRWGIMLCREHTAEWSDIREMYSGMRQSFETYMENTDVKPEWRQLILDNADKQFNGNEEEGIEGILPSLQKKYKDGDPLSALTEAKALLVQCFADVNEDIALVAASQRLSQFLKDYTITFRDDLGEGANEEDPAISNRLDILEKGVTDIDPDTQEPTPITKFLSGEEFDMSPFMDRIFKIVHTPNFNVNANNEEEEVPFSRLDILPGYKLVPWFKGTTKDPYTNTYSIEIDWRCTKISFVGRGFDEDKVTAHVFANNGLRPNITEESEAQSVKDILTDETATPISYPVYLTKKEERIVLYNTYLNNKTNYQINEDETETQYIDFRWPSDKDCPYEAFFQGEKINTFSNDENKERHRLASSDLADSGLEITARERGNQNNESKWIPLNHYVSGSSLTIYEEYPEDLKDEDPNSLVHKFAENCNLTSDSIMSNINATEGESHTESHSFKICYKNTRDAEKTLYKLDAKETSDFKVSENAYRFLVARYNQLKRYVEIFAKNRFADLHESLETEVGLASGLFALVTLLNGACLLFTILNPPKAPWYAAIMITAILSQACQTASLSITIDRKWNKSLEQKQSCEWVAKQPQTQTLLGKLKADKETFSLVDANEDLEVKQNVYLEGLRSFKDKHGSWKETKAALDWYTDMADLDEVKDFMALVEEKGIDPDSFAKVMKDWMPPKGKFFIATISLDSISAALDIANIVLCCKAPEVLPSASGIKAANEAAHGAKLKSADKVIEMVELGEDGKVLSKAAREMRELKTAEALSTTNESLQQIKAWKECVGPNKEIGMGSRRQYSNYIFKELTGCKDTDFLTKDIDLVQRYGSNGWKLFRKKWGGDLPTSKNAMQLFYKRMVEAGKFGKENLTASFAARSAIFAKGAKAGRLSQLGAEDLISNAVELYKIAEAEGKTLDKLSQKLVDAVKQAKTADEYVKALDDLIFGTKDLKGFYDVLEVSSLTDDFVKEGVVGDAILGSIFTEIVGRYAKMIDRIYETAKFSLKLIL